MFPRRRRYLFKSAILVSCNGGSWGGSSTSFRAQAAHFRYSPDSGHVAASRRLATKS